MTGIGKLCPAAECPELARQRTDVDVSARTAANRPLSTPLRHCGHSKADIQD
jgi:hypothetical protein